MAQQLSKTGISSLGTIRPGHVSQSIDAFTGIEAYDISLSGSFNMTGSINVQPGVTNQLTASWAVTASYAMNGGGGGPFNTSGLVTTSSFNSYTGSADSQFAGTASFATSASRAISASFANTASRATSVSHLNQDVIVSGSLTITQNLTVQGSSSIQYISSSQLNIDTNIIRVNTFGNSIRYGGLSVVDSGSSPITSGSLFFDSQKNQWMFINPSIAGTTSSLLLMGPQEFDDQGNENYLTQHKLPKGTGTIHLNDSNISDNGSVVSIGSNTQITGSLLQGLSPQVWGDFTHAEGSGSVARGFASHAEGIRSVTGTILAYSASLVSGSGAQPRITVTLSGSYLNVTSLFSNSPSSSLFIRSPFNERSVSIPISRSYYVAPNTIIESNASANEDFGATIIKDHLIGPVLVGNGGIPSVNWGGNQTIPGDYAHAEGKTTNAIGYHSHTEGESCSALGLGSHAEGAATAATSTAAHSEGYLTKAFGVSSHAEGQDTTSLGNSSHAEGYLTQANNFASHAEGRETIASGYSSHTEGFGTITIDNYQHAQGIHNLPVSGTGAFILGNGTGVNARSNLIYASGSQVQITGSLNISGPSTNMGHKLLVQNSQNDLFSVTDQLSGSLFSVNDISGLPILEVFSDNTTLIGSYPTPSLNTTTRNILSTAGSFIVYTLPTASYDGAWFEYIARSGSNARVGSIMAVWSGSSVNFIQTTASQFGSSPNNALLFTVIRTGSNFALTGSATTAGWTIKTIVRSI